MRQTGKRQTTKDGLTPLEGGGWHVRWVARHPLTQKQVSRTATLPPMTRRQAQQERQRRQIELRDELAAEAAGRVVQRAARRTSVTAYAEQWIEAHGPRWAPSTREKNVTFLAQHILSEIGELAVEDVTRQTCQALLARWASQTSAATGRPYARESIVSWWALCRQLLQDAATDLDLPDPTTRVTTRGIAEDRRQTREHRTYSYEQLATLLEHVRTTAPRWYAETYVDAMTGLRGGEIYALTWRKILVLDGAIEVSRSHWRGHVRERTKTGRSRYASLTDTMGEVLERHREIIAAEGHGTGDDDMVFPSSKRGTPRTTQALYQFLNKKAAEAGLGFGGSQVSRLLEAGIDQTVLRSQMGHVTAEMTQLYADIHAVAKRRAAELHEALAVRPGVRPGPEIVRLDDVRRHVSQEKSNGTD